MLFRAEGNKRTLINQAARALRYAVDRDYQHGSMAAFLSLCTGSLWDHDEALARFRLV